MTLPAILRPYAVLLFDGMGGANGAAVDYVAGLTPKQVAAWYAGPMAEMHKRTEKVAGDGSTPTAPPTKRIGGVMRFASVEEFRTTFGGHAEYASRPVEWWAEKFAQFQAERVSGGES